jgi:23S rRNA pseudouridine1911/1915/1917 synthase
LVHIIYTIIEIISISSMIAVMLSIIYQDKDVLIINKPAGIMVHGDGKTEEKTLCDFVEEEFPETKDVGEPMMIGRGPSREPTILRRPGIVHRLDKETSGVMVVAKNQPAFEILKKQFQDHIIKKTYNTFVWGYVKEDEGVIDRNIGRSKGDFRKWSAQRFSRGELRPAITEFNVLKRFDGDPVMKRGAIMVGKGNSKIPLMFTFVEVHPLTGRTHQIRVHFKAINHPVVGDSLYAENHPYALGFDRLALHARKLKLILPTDAVVDDEGGVSGKMSEFEADLPVDFKKATDALL